MWRARRALFGRGRVYHHGIRAPVSARRRSQARTRRQARARTPQLGFRVVAVAAAHAAGNEEFCTPVCVERASAAAAGHGGERAGPQRAPALACALPDRTLYEPYDGGAAQCHNHRFRRLGRSGRKGRDVPRDTGRGRERELEHRIALGRRLTRPRRRLRPTSRLIARSRNTRINRMRSTSRASFGTGYSYSGGEWNEV